MSDIFDAAVNAVISGDTECLRRMLKDDPDLVKKRSSANHEGMLIHYVAANGVEDDLQKTPANVVDVANILIDAGADVDATAEIYGGGSASTPLVLLVTSAHPARAGLQESLVEVFCKYGSAKVNGINDDGDPMASSIAFFYPGAAGALRSCGARIDNIVFAAAVGDAKCVERFLESDKPGEFKCKPFIGLSNAREYKATAMLYAAMGGYLELVKLFLENGVDVNATSTRNIHLAEATALHLAAYTGQEQVIDFLLEKGANKRIKDSRWESTPGMWAETGGYEILVSKLS